MTSTSPPTPTGRLRPPAWPILIAGGGIPSLVLALALRQGLGEAVAVTVADPARARAGRDARAFALSPAAMGMLDRLGPGEAIRRRAQPIAAMRITDSRLLDPVRPDYLGFAARREDALGFMVEAAVLETALAEAAGGSGVRFLRDTVRSAEAGSPAVAVGLGSGETLRASLLVAADGARSRLRALAGIGWTGRRYGQSALVAAVAHERPHDGIAVQHFLPAGPFAILPLAGPGRHGPHRSSIVWTEQEAEAARIVALPAEDALAELERRFGHRLGAVALETPLGSWPLGIGIARRFVGERLALLGDAAHEIHPLAGQGLNLGLADAAALAEQVADSVRLGLDPGRPEVLRGYERDRRFDAVALAGATDGLNRLFSNDSLPVRALRDLGLGLVDRLPGLKGLFAREAAGATGRAPRLMRGEPL